MPYNKLSWTNFDTGTPLSAERLSHIETQYENAMTDVAGAVNNPSSPIAQNMTTVINDVVEGVTDGMVTSEDADTIVAFTEASDLVSAPDGSLALLYGRGGVGVDFLAGLGEIIQVFGEGTWTHEDGTSVNAAPVEANAWRGAVVAGLSGSYRDVEVVVRARYMTSGAAGLQVLPFVRGSHPTGGPSFLYAGIQNTSTDSSASGGLRMNATISGASGAITSGATSLNSASRNTAGTFYYIRLRAIGDSVMCKQWIASNSEPATWDLILSGEELPARFRTGENRKGMVGFVARGQLEQSFDWFGVAFDGATAPLKED